MGQFQNIISTVIFGMLSTVLLPQVHAEVTFTPLGDMPGGSSDSKAWTISRDGTAIAGMGTPAQGFEAAYWPPAPSEGIRIGLNAKKTGSARPLETPQILLSLGKLPQGRASVALGVADKGEVIVGNCLLASGTEAFLWTARTGMVGLGDLPGGTSDSVAYGVSADGRVIIGYGTSARGQEAFRWTQGTGMVALGDLPGGGFASSARAASANGSILVGDGSSTSGMEAFRWTQAGGMVGLGDLPGGVFSSTAQGISSDGRVVVGSGTSANGREAFRWTQATGMVGLGGSARRSVWQ